MGAHVRLVHLALLVGCLAAGGCTRWRRRPRDRPPPLDRRVGRRLRPGAPEASPATGRGPGGWPDRPAGTTRSRGTPPPAAGCPAPRSRSGSRRRARSFDVRAYRIGAYAGGEGRLVWGSSRLPGHVQARPTFADRERRTVVAPWRTDTRRPHERVGTGALRVQAARLVGLAGAGAVRRHVADRARPGGARAPGDHLAGLQRLGRLLAVRGAGGGPAQLGGQLRPPLPAPRRDGDGVRRGARRRRRRTPRDPAGLLHEHRRRPAARRPRAGRGPTCPRARRVLVRRRCATA